MNKNLSFFKKYCIKVELHSHKYVILFERLFNFIINQINNLIYLIMFF